jgi:glycosyltransferase involved in cell wall biosynthesis
MSNSGMKDPIFLKSQNINLIPYGVEDFFQNRDVLSKKKNGKFVILFVGICRESKGIIDFVNIINLANKVNKNISGRIIGKIFGKKEDQVIKEGVKKGFISYEGIQIGDDKIKLYLDANLFLFPTFFEHENFPTVILEAFSAGLPVISTNWRGIPNQIINEVNGYIYDVHDIKGMVDKVLELANNPRLCEKLSKNSREIYQKFYTDSIFEKNIVNFFRALS